MFPHGPKTRETLICCPGCLFRFESMATVPPFSVLRLHWIAGTKSWEVAIYGCPTLSDVKILWGKASISLRLRFINLSLCDTHVKRLRSSDIFNPSLVLEPKTDMLFQSGRQQAFDFQKHRAHCQAFLCVCTQTSGHPLSFNTRWRKGVQAIATAAMKFSKVWHKPESGPI
jgi:hypothetical protein